MAAPLEKASTRYSSGIIAGLISSGLSQTDIAQMLGVSKSFISRVAGGHRSLTIDHLAAIERKLNKSASLILLEGIPRQNEAFELVKDRARIGKLFDRPVRPESNRPLTPAEQVEMEGLLRNADAGMNKLMEGLQRASKQKSSSPTPTRARSVQADQVIEVLHRDAGLSLRKARQVYEVQSKYADKHHLALFEPRRAAG